MTDTDAERQLTEMLAGIIPQTTERTIDTGRAWRELQKLRVRSSRNRRKGMAAAVTLAVAAALTIAVPTLAGGGGVGRRASPGQSSHAPGPVSNYPGAIVARLPVSDVGAVVQDGTRVWAIRSLGQTKSGTTPSQLVAIDLATDKVVLRKDLGTAQTTVAAGGGGVWLTTSHWRPLGQVERIDPVTGKVLATMHLAAGRCMWVSFAAGSLWAGCRQGPDSTEFFRLNPETGKPQQNVGSVHMRYVGPIAIAPQGIWFVTNSGISGLVGAGSRYRTITVKDPNFPASFALTNSLVYGLGSIWALTNDESVARINPATGRVVRIYTYRDYDPTYSGGLSFLAVGQGSLWFLDDATANVAPQAGVLRVSIATGRPQGFVPTFGPMALEAVRALAAGQQIYSTPSAIWVPSQGRLIRIDPARMPG